MKTHEPYPELIYVDLNAILARKAALAGFGVVDYHCGDLSSQPQAFSNLLRNWEMA